MVYVRFAVMPVVIGDTFLKSTVEAIKHHLILYSNYIKLKTYSNVLLLQVNVFQVPTVELDASGFLKVLTTASDSIASIDLCALLTIKDSAISHQTEFC